MEQLEALAAPPEAAQTAFTSLRGHAPAFRRALDMARRAAATDCSVLIVGETGTGKELVARAIHQASPRAAMPYVAVNCGAISRELIGSELFGHERGSFTGAMNEHDGMFAQAHGGTLFLDELGELPLEQQPHLLRVLENRTVRRLGGSDERVVDVRLVAATNRLENLGTDASKLRLDLFHRVATVVVHLPPLRERRDDIALLARLFMDEFAPTLGQYIIEPTVVQALTRYRWPGNVRELRQAIKRAMALGNGELALEHLLPTQNGQSGQGSQHGQHGQGGDPEHHEPTRGNSAQKAYHISAAGFRQRTMRASSPRGIVPIVRLRGEFTGESGESAESGESGESGNDLRPIDIIIRNALLDALEMNRSIRTAARSLGMAKSTFADWAKRLGIVMEP